MLESRWVRLGASARILTSLLALLLLTLLAGYHTAAPGSDLANLLLHPFVLVAAALGTLVVLAEALDHFLPPRAQELEYDQRSDFRSDFRHGETAFMQGHPVGHGPEVVASTNLIAGLVANRKPEELPKAHPAETPARWVSRQAC